VIEPAAFCETLRRHGMTFFTGVPDSLLKDLCAYVNDQTPAQNHVINANEGAAVALAAGYHLATGRIPVVYLQNSGFGNAINPLLSLADPSVYSIPILFIIGWRGEPGIPDEPQHIAQGHVMTELLRAVGLEYDILDADTHDFDELVGRAAKRMTDEGRCHALLVRRNTFAPYQDGPRDGGNLPLTRATAIDLVLDHLKADDLIVSTTGMMSRELFQYREFHGQSHRRDFLTVGSMGHCSQIALGLAQHQPSRDVVCLDGDGSLIMHMGSLAIIGTQGPSNFTHIVINNAAHDSVGGQPTAASHIDLSSVARACGYRNVREARTADDVVVAMEALSATPGPRMLEIRVLSSPHTDAGRPRTAPVEDRIAFMKALGHAAD
jgi:phosphonopyruvate decarboxylase